MDIDLQTMVGVVGVPGALAFVILKMYGRLADALDRNTKAMYYLASMVGAKIEGDQNGGQ